MTFDLDIYQQRAMETEADQQDITHRNFGLYPANNNIIIQLVRLMNGIHGLSDEVGELNSALKKHFEYGKELDVDNVKEEVGDCLWRLAQICKACEFSLADAATANIAKLQRVRYRDGFSNKAADENNRDRDAEAGVMREFEQYGDGVIIHTGKNWAKLLGVRVLNPDGWYENNLDFEKSPIDRQLFEVLKNTSPKLSSPIANSQKVDMGKGVTLTEEECHRISGECEVQTGQGWEEHPPTVVSSLETSSAFNDLLQKYDSMTHLADVAIGLIDEQYHRKLQETFDAIIKGSAPERKRDDSNIK